MSTVSEENQLDVVSIPEYAARLSEPFTMIELLEIDDMVLSIFLCQGTLPRHRHLDQDELFLVHSGTISLESEWGSVVLRPGELSLAPKGVAHRSSSLLHSLVLLLQPRLMVNRRNGDRRVFALKDGGRLEKVNLTAVGRQIAIPHRPVVLAHVDTYALQMTYCEGVGPWRQSDRQQSLVFCFDGRLTVETGDHEASLESGELLVVPQGIAHRLVSAKRALVIGLQRHKQPGVPIEG